MSYINGKPAEDWIDENRPDTGLFKAYWKDAIDDDHGDATLDPDVGVGLRYEWYYKDGKRADGVSKCWYPGGKLKSERHYKNGLRMFQTDYHYKKSGKVVENSVSYGTGVPEYRKDNYNRSERK